MGLSNIMIVEDSKSTASLMTLLLRLLGHNVTHIVASGEEAIKLAKSRNIDLILMDIRLDGQIDGIEAAKVIRGFSAIPIVFVSAYSDSEIIERAMGIGAVDYIRKPFRTKQFTDTMENFSLA